MKPRRRYAPTLLILCLTALAAQTGLQYKFYPAGNFPGAVATTPLAISLEHIVGYYEGPGGGVHAYIQTGTSFANAERPGSLASYLSSINKYGLAVGGRALRAMLSTSLQPTNQKMPWRSSFGRSTGASLTKAELDYVKRFDGPHVESLSGPEGCFLMFTVSLGGGQGTNFKRC